MRWTRREWLWGTMGGILAGRLAAAAPVEPLRIARMKVTPVALPDPPLLAASGCHGPYFLRNIIELYTEGGIVGVGETHGGARLTAVLEGAAREIVGRNAFAYRSFFKLTPALTGAAYSGIELACLDACGKATGRRLCELLGGPVRDSVEFAAYLFYRYAADHPRLRDDPRIVPGSLPAAGRIDDFGAVRTPAAMGELADVFRRRWGFRVYKLKAGVLAPDAELESLQALAEKLGPGHPLRIDPNARWSQATAERIGARLRALPLEYYEDPVRGQEAMAAVRRQTQLPMSTNMCVTRFEHIPEAVQRQPVDVVLGDHHGWGGMTAVQTLGKVCETFGWGLSQHSNSHAGITMAALIHLAAAVPQLSFASDTHYVWLPEGADLIAGPNLPIRAGHMQLPQEPGLGVTLDLDKLARAHEVYQKCGMRQRDDAATMRRLVPDWSPKPF